MGSTSSPPARVAWIETSMGYSYSLNSRSPPARVAWIETFPRGGGTGSDRVATREGGVDRNVRRQR